MLGITPLLGQPLRGHGGRTLIWDGTIFVIVRFLLVSSDAYSLYGLGESLRVVGHEDFGQLGFELSKD